MAAKHLKNGKYFARIDLKSFRIPVSFSYFFLLNFDTAVSCENGYGQHFLNEKHTVGL